ncbi:unnamed protein product (macronuclear) [Paramecium tetraurelia]|uniref:Uncharacterized protein n=1 Tax=Paramecium tetraurelia TaxID=5888 RepID=A0EET5_PARTE|nr:uncharacterized protein GSPATT00026149001 [Paramecium tetraurelia]CAK93826.1 unnamed protein product [Paramecium tetraurelia]|eukprot:XP_001461199.1 hypothetical protein (macronuclear) [Paramecium tetraurelia strain d4-2]
MDRSFQCLRWILNSQWIWIIFLLGYYLKSFLKIHKQDIKKEIFYAQLALIKQHYRLRLILIIIAELFLQDFAITLGLSKNIIEQSKNHCR